MRKKVNGCNDYHQKLNALFAIAGIDDTASFEKKVEAIYDKYKPNSETLRSILQIGSPEELKRKEIAIRTNIVTSARTYDRHNPTGATGRVFLAVVQTLFDKNGINGSAKHLIQNETYARFYSEIPMNRREIISPPVDGESRADVSVGHSLTHKAFPTIHAGILKGRIDQLLHYANPDGPASWDAIRKHPSYKQSKECMETLDELLLSDIWSAHLENQRSLHLFMLGGGAAEKDAAIIKSALNSNDKKSVVYRLFDASQPMIVHTLRSIRDLLRGGLMNRIEASYTHCDFTTLLDIDPGHLGYRKGTDKLTWFCPGGTIGNLNEESVFKAISRQSQLGDLFVVGAEHLDDSLGDSDIESKYTGPGIESFVTAPLMSASAWDRSIAMKVADERFRLNPPKLLSVELSKAYTSVPGARTLELSMPIDYRNLVLHTSTRYPCNGLPLLAEKHGFALREMFKSTSNPLYRTFLFEHLGQ